MYIPILTYLPIFHLSQDFKFSISGFIRRGGISDKHVDGFGLAVYKKKGDLETFFDDNPACVSPIAFRLTQCKCYYYYSNHYEVFSFFLCHLDCRISYLICVCVFLLLLIS